MNQTLSFRFKFDHIYFYLFFFVDLQGDKCCAFDRRGAYIINTFFFYFFYTFAKI